ncbi:hypothetical protein RQP46_007721 [Phenoliferia psychrophenolica]
MPPRQIPASFWRGGTSRGLLFRAKDLAPYTQGVRDNIIQQALGSPDPAGRQISGLGGGVSSLSKACIIGPPGEGVEDQRIAGLLPGPAWADTSDVDVVYRFCQVGIRDTTMDWAASCGNMLAAVAFSAVSTPLIPYSTLFSRARSLPQPPMGSPLLFPLSILSASNGKIMRARVPIDPMSLQMWEPPEGQGCQIAGVPGEDAGIEVEMPIELGEEGGGWLVTGREKDVVVVDGLEIPVSILTSGLPNIFVSIASLNLPTALLASSSSTLTSHPTLPSLLEKIRTTAASQFSIPLSLASPKITLIGPLPPSGFTSTAGVVVSPHEADLLVRAVSSGDFHATIPGTTLGALNLGLGIKGTVVHDVARGGGAVVADNAATSKEVDNVVTVRAAHSAGVSTASVRFEGEGGERRPTSVVMLRTAREIMRGSVGVPERVFNGELVE